MKVDIPITYFINWRTVTNEMIPSAMEYVAASGIENIVLTDSLMPRLSDLDFHALLIKSAADAGLTFVDAHATIQETELLGLAPEKNRRAMIRHSENQLYLASEFGCKTCTFHCWNWRPDSHSTEERFNYICDSLEKLLPTAEKADVIMAIENVWSPAATADMLVKIVKHFNFPYLGLCYDAGHAFIFDHGRVDPESSFARFSWDNIQEIPWDSRTLEKMLPYLVNCHLHDNTGFSDNHIMPGKGLIDWKHIVSQLVKAPNLKCIQSEVVAKWQDGEVKTLKQDFEKIFDL